jgi:hypothetical protein
MAIAEKDVQEAAAGAAAPAAPVVDRKKWGAPDFLRSPWLLLAAALIVGGFWLVLHPAVIADNINKPYALLAGPALAGSFLVCWIIVKFFEAIEHAARSAWAAFLKSREQDSSAQFFWIVIAVFLAVSVFASGDFFSKLEHDALWGLGYATALFIDLVAVQCMRARLNAGRLRDRRGQSLYLLGVLICASASAFANVYTSLTTFVAPTGNAAGALPGWMAAIAPWFGLVFPALIVLLSMTADYTVDQTSSKLDPESYKAQEEKRVKLLGYQRDMLKDRVTIEREIDELAATLRGRKEQRVFFLWAWLFPLQVSGAHVLAQVEDLYKPQLDALIEQNELLRGQLVNVANNAQAAYAGLDQNLQQFINERIEGLAASLAVAPAAEPDYQTLTRRVIPLLAPTLAGLRQELADMIPATAPAAPEIDYAELARAVAPLLPGLYEANIDAIAGTNGQNNHEHLQETEQMAAIDLGAFTPSNENHKPDTNELANLEHDASLAALLERPTVSLEDAARIIEKDIKYVRTLRSRGNLKGTPRNQDLITTASIKDYLIHSRRPVKA